MSVIYGTNGCVMFGSSVSGWSGPTGLVRFAISLIWFGYDFELQTGDVRFRVPGMPRRCNPSFLRNWLYL